MDTIKISTTQQTRINDVDWDHLGFGVYFADHVFIADYHDGAWRDLRIEPYGPMPVSPGMCTLHYGQTIFEGLKAFRTKEGHANVFRPYKNAARLNHSAELVCIPQMDTDMVVEGIRQLVKLDQKWIPAQRGHSLYIRPVVYGNDDFLGVRPSNNYRLIIMTSPVAAYYAEGLNPVRIMVSTEWVRAVKGGLGSAKTAANYAASLYGAHKAKEAGFSQVLWLDGVTHEFVDEVGTMNIMFIIDNELITPALDSGTILAGVTRDSVLNLARDFGMKVSERRITIDEVVAAHRKGTLQEVFGTGTAAVISPVGELIFKGESMKVNDMKIGPVAQRFYDTITGIQYGEIEDRFNWNLKVDL
jgi:branched-chain amino acid aminotransferase